MLFQVGLHDDDACCNKALTPQDQRDPPRPMFFFPVFKNALLFHSRKKCLVSPCSMNTALNSWNSIWSLIHLSVLPSHLCFKL